MEEIGYKTPRTSLTHPIRVSWILDDTCKFERNLRSETPTSLSLHGKRKLDLSKESLYDPTNREKFEIAEMQLKHAVTPSWNETRGNFGLSSCPGKKVRVTGPKDGKGTFGSSSNDIS
jgi:hypothetical protein